MRSRRHVVTGASGFIGDALIRRLIGAGEEVVLFARAGEETLLEQRTVAAGASPRQARVLTVDWEVPASVVAGFAVARPSVVYHLAGARVLGNDPDALAANFAANLATVERAVGALIGSPPDAFVLTSTGEVYGDQPAPLHEELVPRPRTFYGAAKLAAETLGLAAHGAAGFPFVAARLAVVYGPGQAPVMFLPQLVRALLAGEAFVMSPGAQWRDFIFVDDAAAALMALARTTAAHGEVVNVGFGGGIRLLELAETAARLAGRPGLLRPGAVPYRMGEIMDYRLSIDRMTRWTGWTPAVALEEGLRRTIEAARVGTPAARETTSSAGP